MNNNQIITFPSLHLLKYCVTNTKSTLYYKEIWRRKTKPLYYWNLENRYDNHINKFDLNTLEIENLTANAPIHSIAIGNPFKCMDLFI